MANWLEAVGRTNAVGNFVPNITGTLKDLASIAAFERRSAIDVEDLNLRKRQMDMMAQHQAKQNALLEEQAKTLERQRKEAESFVPVSSVAPQMGNFPELSSHWENAVKESGYVIKEIEGEKFVQRGGINVITNLMNTNLDFAKKSLDLTKAGLQNQLGKINGLLSNQENPPKGKDLENLQLQKQGLLKQMAGVLESDLEFQKQVVLKQKEEAPITLAPGATVLRPGKEPYTAPTKPEKPPSTGNANETAIIWKFGDDRYLTDPDLRQKANKWLGTEEGKKFTAEAAKTISAPGITVVPTSEGLTAVPTRGAGMVAPGTNIGGKPLSAEQASKIGELEAMRVSLGNIKELYNPKFVGPVMGRVGGVQEKYLGSASDEQVRFYSYVRDIQDALLRARSGAQINEQEYKRLTNFLPEPNLPASSFESRLKRFEDSLNIILNTKAKALSEAGYGKKSNPASPAAPKAKKPLSSFDR